MTHIPSHDAAHRNFVRKLRPSQPASDRTQMRRLEEGFEGRAPKRAMNLVRGRIHAINSPHTGSQRTSPMITDAPRRTIVATLAALCGCMLTITLAIATCEAAEAERKPGDYPLQPDSLVQPG